MRSSIRLLSQQTAAVSTAPLRTLLCRPSKIELAGRIPSSNFRDTSAPYSMRLSSCAIALVISVILQLDLAAIQHP